MAVICALVVDVSVVKSGSATDELTRIVPTLEPVRVTVTVTTLPLDSPDESVEVTVVRLGLLPEPLLKPPPEPPEPELPEPPEPPELLKPPEVWVDCVPEAEPLSEQD